MPLLLLRCFQPQIKLFIQRNVVRVFASEPYLEFKILAVIIQLAPCFYCSVTSDIQHITVNRNMAKLIHLFHFRIIQ
ncbi:MAG: BC10 family protein [Oscillospiraceae bacterium]|nr:BC10 family protein [Oscillospiraceae bacterium]